MAGNKLWILRPVDVLDKKGPWNPWYDTCCGFVISADSEHRARKIASESGGDEISDEVNPWLSYALTNCHELTADISEGVVMEDLHAA